MKLLFCFVTFSFYFSQVVFAQQQSVFTIPKTKVTQMIASHLESGAKNYLAFPTVMRLNEEEVLITFKRGYKHGGDHEADSEMITFNTVRNKVLNQQTIGSSPNLIYQLAVPVKMAPKDIRYYVDMQNLGIDGKNYRTGMYFTKAGIDGKSIEGWKKLDKIDGIEYGYPFDFIVEGKTVYMLAMSFGYRPGDTWSVAVLKSQDGGNTWNRAINVTEAIGGGAYNESSFVRVGKEFFIVLRGYGTQSTRVARFSADFKLLGVEDLTGEDKDLGNYIGWPRIFYKDDNLYVLGRIWMNNKLIKGQTINPYHIKNSTLGLVRLDKNTMKVNKVSMLDNPPGEMTLKDGYYAGFYWQRSGNKNWFNTITYRAEENAQAPDIIRLGFNWDEVK